MFIFAVISSSILGMAYTHLIHFIPFPYINFFITSGFGALVGIATGFGGKFSKIRNKKILLNSRIIAGCIAVYASWVGYVFISSGYEILLFNPLAIIKMAKIIAMIGPWSIFGLTVKNGLLYFIWLVEAIIIIGTTLLFTLGVVANALFCEKCNKWISNKKIITNLEPIKNLETKILQYQKGNFSDL